MTSVLVTGATGELGRLVVARLLAGRHQTRILSHRHAPSAAAGVEVVAGDLVSGEGLPEAVAGVGAIIHIASDSRSPQEVDVTGSRRLLATAQVSGGASQPPHIIYISIVGVDRSASPYYQAKYAVESLIAQSGLPWSVLRATQFHSFAENILHTLEIDARADAQAPVTAPDGVRLQPVDSEEVAERLVALAELGPISHVAQMGGPEALTVEALASAYLRARGRPALVQVGEVQVAPRMASLFAAFRTGINLTPEHGFGLITWADYLQRKYR